MGVCKGEIVLTARVDMALCLCVFMILFLPCLFLLVLCRHFNFFHANGPPLYPAIFFFRRSFYAEIYHEKGMTSSAGKWKKICRAWKAVESSIKQRRQGETLHQQTLTTTSSKENKEWK
jgi:hypothetical protein